MNPIVLGTLLGKAVDGIGKIADDLSVSEEERRKSVPNEPAASDTPADTRRDAGPVEEGASAGILVAGWRPWFGWVGVAAVAYQFVLYPILTWVWVLFKSGGWVPENLPPPPVIDVEALAVFMTGVLGIGGMRSFDKAKGRDTKQIGRAKPKP